MSEVLSGSLESLRCPLEVGSWHRLMGGGVCSHNQRADSVSVSGGVSG